MSIILKAENISKQYRLGLVGTGTVKDDLNRWWHQLRGKEDPYLKVGGINDRSAIATGNYVWALRNINFEVREGEVLGIIGKNGAGKSSLLKILSRVTSPTTGSIKTKGRIASLLEVGTGFHGELTGRENIFLNGAILGMTKPEITSKLDEIIDFSGCEMYIDTPVKRYSSGMTVRLGFAVAAHLEPEILVVDEVLAVGDADFQKKAIGKMQDLSKGEGRTVLFVSHNMPSVQALCTRACVMEKGGLSNFSNVEEAIDFYLQNPSPQKTRLRDLKERGGSNNLKVVDLKILRGNKRVDLESLVCGESYDFEFCVQNFSSKRLYFHLGISFYSYSNKILNASGSEHQRDHFSIGAYESIIIKNSYRPFPLTLGKYFLNIACNSREFGLEDFIQNKITIKVLNGNYFNKSFSNFPKEIVLLNNIWHEGN